MQLDEAKAEVEQNSQELDDEMSSSWANGTLWVWDITLQQFLALAPMFKWLDKYFPTKEDEPMEKAPTEQDPTEKDSHAAP